MSLLRALVKAWLPVIFGFVALVLVRSAGDPETPQFSASLNFAAMLVAIIGLYLVFKQLKRARNQQKS